jgi:CHAT domain-containing protein
MARGVLEVAKRGLLLLCLSASLAHAQIDADGPGGMSEAERQKWQAILAQPIDANALNTTRTNVYRQKDLAAFKLGDAVARETILREWSQFDEEGRWSLRGFLSGTEKREEAYVIGKNLIQAVKWPPSAARIRLHVASDYLDDSNIKETARLLAEVENIVRYELPRMPSRPETQYWIARTELEFLTLKARYAVRTGKWQEGIEGAKLAMQKGRDLTKLVQHAPTENAKQWGMLNALMAAAELASQQTNAGLFADAEWTLRDTLKMGKEIGLNENGLIGIYNRIADLYLATGQFQLAMQYAARSEKILLDQGYVKGSRNWVWTQTRQNAAYAGTKQWLATVQNFQRVDEAVQRAGARSSGPARQTVLRAYVFLNADRHSDALRLMNAQMKWSVDNFGEDHYYTSRSRGLWAVALWKNGEFTQAKENFARAFKGMTNPESLSGDFTEKAIDKQINRFVLQSYMTLLSQTAATDAQDAQTIFVISDQLNTSTVQQALNEAAVRAGATAPGLSDLIRKEQDAKNEIATLTGYITGQAGEEEKRRNPQVVTMMRQRMAELAAERKGYKQKIQKDFPEYFQLLQPSSPKPQELAKFLQPDEVFVAVTPLSDATYVWLIDAQGKVNFHKATLTEDQIKVLVDNIRKTLDVAELGPKAPAFDYASSHALYRELLGPLEASIKDKQHVVLSTSGHLARMPLAVLTRQAYKGPPAQAPWLIKDVAVSHVPSANGWLALKKLSATQSAKQTLMAWGDPIFDAAAPQQVAAVSQTRQARPALPTRSLDAMSRSVIEANQMLTYSKIPPLPETRDEVLQLATILKADPARDLKLGAQATRQSVLDSSKAGSLAQRRVVVFATHGLLAGDLPYLNQPALAMAATPDPAQSPLLTLEDVLGLKLNADWVVLSACNTAGADGRAEEALSGLARGFFYAGSRSLLVTHWAVESQSAMLLTTRTFESYINNAKVGRSQALQQAMLHVMQNPQFAHPTYWAPYALVGEGGR